MTWALVRFLPLPVICWFVWKLVRGQNTKTTLDNLPGPHARSVITGDMAPVFDRREGWEYHKELIDKYGTAVRLRGLFMSNVLFISDPAALQHMAVKDGILYELPKWTQVTNLIVFGPGLLSVTGSQHRRQRKMLNPIFSVDNLRKMTPLFHGIARKLQRAIAAQARVSSGEVDVIHWFSRAALEFIAQGGMGHTFDPLVPRTAAISHVGKAFKEVIPVMYALQRWRMLAVYLKTMGSPQLRRKLADLAVAIFPDPNLARLRDIVNTMDFTSKQIYEAKRKFSGSDTDVGGDWRDIMSILLASNAQSKDENKLTDKELLAQMSTMLFAGTDTTSNALGRTLQALAEHPDMQDKLREELDNARDFAGQDIPYDNLVALPLLDAVCRETLRVFSPINVVPRETIADAIMPLSRPIQGRNGIMISELAIPKGTLILPSFSSCNTAKSIWGEDAMEWRPERWLAPLPATVTESRIPGVYSNLMTFGAGGRSCIGFRFSQLEMKVVLSIMLEHFRFDLTDRPIIWNMSGVSYPTMDKNSVEPSLVLKVVPLQSDC